MLKKILIANRGEIACRIARSAERLGIKTVAVYSDADAGALHVRACDEAVHIGPSPASDSYLRIDKIIGAAKAVGADAIHPGYGFLSENSDLPDACKKAGPHLHRADRRGDAGARRQGGGEGDRYQGRRACRARLSG